MDELNRKILTLLQRDARMKRSEIARQLHLSVTAVTRRIERMEDEGVIQGYRTMVDPVQAGMEVHGFLIGGVYPVTLDRLYAYIASVPEIVRCETIISGGKEILVEFYCRDTEHLMEFYNSGIRNYLDSMTVYLVKGRPGKDRPLQLE
jgi:Lrp/AsnC family leucine-responsive transcriptional regulator